ncbi:MAG: site-2 protease family protein [Myxococcaceae bacterium]|jgi:Zn-dependent protease|nr:site-2 protease family protein [Myxococcaceae bacterium]
MRWAWRAGRLFGIDVYVHATFLLLLGWVGTNQYLRERNVGAAAVAVGFVALVFTSVVLHELGHALMARRFGITTKDITLLPIGGVARLERMPEKPAHELLVALAGPAVNVVIAGLLVGVVWLLGGSPGLDAPDATQLTRAPLLTRLAWVNVSLAAFNLLPAFPMDGGRVLRALLAMRQGAARATRTAAAIGQAFAVALGLLGVFVNPVLVLVAVFVWFGAAAEAGAEQTKAALAGLTVRAAMQTDFRVLAPHDGLAVAAQALLAGAQVDFPVVDGANGLVGVLTRARLVEGLSAGGPTVETQAVMTRRFETAEPGERLDAAWARLRTSDCRSMPVVDAGRVVGLVTAENLGELVMLHGAALAAKAGA